jgi:hypothetical protein
MAQIILPLLSHRTPFKSSLLKSLKFSLQKESHRVRHCVGTVKAVGSRGKDYNIKPLPEVFLTDEEYAELVPDDVNEIWGVENKELIRRQVCFEKRSIDLATDRYAAMKKTIVDMGQGSSLKPAQRLLLNWYTPLVEAIELEQNEFLKRSPSVDRERYGFFLSILSPQKMAVIVMHTALNQLLLHATGVKFATVAMDIGTAVQREIQLERLKGEKGAWSRMVSMGRVTPGLVSRFSKRVLQNEEWPPMLKVCFILRHMDSFLTHTMFVSPSGNIGEARLCLTSNAY